MRTSRRLRIHVNAWVAATLSVLGCAEGPTAPDRPLAASAQPRAGTLTAADGERGKPAPGYVVHPMTVAFADRAGDDITSDGSGPYTDGIDGRWALTDYSDPLRPDHFMFHPGNGANPRLIGLGIPGVVPPSDCDYFRFSVRDEDTPDLSGTGDGWSGTGEGTLQCEEGRGEYLLHIGECVAMTRGAGLWSVAADGCGTEIWSGSGRKARLLGTFSVSFAFEALDL